jgi:polynucleotide 5'-hydroxyl-kinase GRC3/NOL9
MLSAVAARKAATSAQAQILTPNVYVPPPSERSKSAAKSSSKPLSAQKRKSSASIPRSTPRALKKQKAKNEVLHLSETSNGWEDLQADTDAAGGTLMDQETPLVGNETSQPSPAVITFTGHRQWSPSRPAIETSSSDEETDVASAVPVIPLPPAVQTSTEDATVLSTFTPIYGQNTFRPTAAESTVLFGSSFDSSSHTVVIILRPRETLCLLGTYQLNVLKGSVTVDGTPLVPSPVSHHIFAPRSSPLPVVSPRYTDEETLAAEVDHIPVRMGSKTEGGGALLALRELRTGVEALGHIHPRFSGVFRPEPRQHPQSVDGNGLGLVGVTLVYTLRRYTAVHVC